MNTTKAKVSFLLFVIFIALYSTMYNPKLYFISFLATTFFILLEKTQIAKKINLPFTIPYQSIIILCILILGFLYLHNKFFKRESFENNTNEIPNKEIEPTEQLTTNTKIEDQITPEIKRYIDKLVAKERQIVKENAKLQMNLDKQNIAFQEKVYKVQKEIENNEEKVNKKQQSIDKKNLLLFKQNLAKHMPEIGSEINKEIIQLFMNPTKDGDKELSFVDKVIESIRRSYKIISQEDRMVYVGTSSLIISFALMLLDISL